MAEAAELGLQIGSVDRGILKAILELPETIGWSGGPYTPYRLVDVPRYTSEFERVKAHFEASVYAAPISKIQRVENPFLLAEFLLKKRELGHSVKVKYLFHATSKANIEKICAQNFDWRLRGSSRGHKFGQGTSFARDAFYATHFDQGSDMMIYAKVLVGRSAVGNVFTTLPGDGFDTTQNNDGTVVVKYDDDVYYPNYIIHYGTVGRIDRSTYKKYVNEMLVKFDRIMKSSGW